MKIKKFFENYEFTYTPNNTKVIITYERYEGYGSSWCHNQDFDFKSQKVGEHIAFTRAQIDLLGQIQAAKHEQLKGAKRLFQSFVSKKKGEHIIKRMEDEIDKIAKIRKTLKKDLREYLTTLERNHQIVRRIRQSKDKNSQV